LYTVYVIINYLICVFYKCKLSFNFVFKIISAKSRRGGGRRGWSFGQHRAAAGTSGKALWRPRRISALSGFHKRYLNWCHDAEHNDNPHNDIQSKSKNLCTVYHNYCSEYHLFQKCLVSFCWVALFCWVFLCWLSFF